MTGHCASCRQPLIAADLPFCARCGAPTTQHGAAQTHAAAPAPMHAPPAQSPAPMHAQSPAPQPLGAAHMPYAPAHAAPQLQLQASPLQGWQLSAAPQSPPPWPFPSDLYAQSNAIYGKIPTLKQLISTFAFGALSTFIISIFAVAFYRKDPHISITIITIFYLFFTTVFFIYSRSSTRKKKEEGRVQQNSYSAWVQVLSVRRGSYSVQTGGLKHYQLLFQGEALPAAEQPAHIDRARLPARQAVSFACLAQELQLHAIVPGCWAACLIENAARGAIARPFAIAAPSGQMILVGSTS